MTIKAVIFDMGGVLLLTGDESRRRTWEARLGLAEGGLFRTVFGSEVDRRAAIGQVPASAVWEYVGEKLGVQGEQLKELERDFWFGGLVNTTLVEFIRELRPQYKTAVLSNAWSDARAAITDEFGLAGYFDTMVFSAEEGVVKPDKRIYRIVTDRLGVQFEEATFIDDVAENIAAARALGMLGVQYQSPTQTIAEVKSYLDGRY